MRRSCGNGQVCPSSSKCVGKKLRNCRNFIFTVLKDRALKLGLVTNFKVLFPVVSMVSSLPSVYKKF